MKKLHVALLQQGPLTAKEARVLRYLCLGYSRLEIANEQPQRSESTINRHVESIAYKLDAHCQAEIVSTAVALGLVKIEIDQHHSLFSKMVIAVLLVFSVFGGNVDMRRSPTPRPIRTARTSNRTNRSTDQYPEENELAYLLTKTYTEQKV